MKTGNLKIHSENILPIIKKWLYSEKDIFVRELVSNACDALQKLRRLQSCQEIEGIDEQTFKINIQIDEKKKTLTFSDNGLGMDHDEVEKYIAQVAFSGAEDFIQKYQSNKEEDQIIGHFGLGFYSSYMVAENVVIETLSYKKEADPVFWSCDGSSTYSIDKGQRKERGTDIILNLEKGAEEFLDATKMRSILMQYCGFLPFPIYLNGLQINDKPPLWIKSPSECTDKEYLDFYHVLFPMEQEPLFWIHLNVDFPFHLKGILYFPKLNHEGDLKKESLRLFCNRVFVSDHCKDLLPDYLTVLRGAIDSTDIPLNVSRSYLQMDKTVRQLGTHISKKIADRLTQLFQTEQEKFYSLWNDIELIIKFGALQDEKFYEKIKTILVWRNTQEKWVSVEEYIQENGKTVYYALDDKHSEFLKLYKEKNIECLYISASVIDQAIIEFLERKHDVKFQRVDGGYSDKILDPSREKGLLDSEGRSESARIAEWFRKKLSQENIEVEAKSLASETLPGFLMIKEEERRFRDSLLYRNKEFKNHSWVKPIFVINTNSKLIQSMQILDKKDPVLAKELANTVYDLACLSQKEMQPERLSQFIQQNIAVLEKLAKESKE